MLFILVTPIKIHIEAGATDCKGFTVVTVVTIVKAGSMARSLELSIVDLG